MAEVVVGVQQLQARLHAVGGARFGAQLMNRLGLATVREAKLLVPRKTGNLGRSIHIASSSATQVVVAASAQYAGYVEFGTAPHEITPRARKALRFAATAAGRRLTGTPRKGAAVVFAKRVHHPGTRAQPFMMPGARKAVANAHLGDAVVQAWNEAA